MRGKISSFKFSFLFPIVLFGTILASTSPAHAIPVEDIPATIFRSIKGVIDKSGSQIFNNVLRTAINQLAYDYATYLGSGAPGQKPFFEQKPLGDRILEAGDSALGQFVEDLSQYGLQTDNPDGTVTKEALDLCSPDIFTLNKITLGITDYGRPAYQSGSCSFTQLKNNWQNQYDQIASIVNDKDYLQKLGSYFDPGGSDLAISFELFGKAQEEILIAAQKTDKESQENKGWIRVEGLVSKQYQDAPGNQEGKGDQVRDAQTQSLGQITGDIFVDAANIFLNQLALSAFNKLMNNIGSDSSNSSGSGDQFAQGGRGGVLEIENKLSTIVQARFGDRTDYNILGELISCPNPDKPGPTNCVITDSFSTAVSKRMTVIDAINAGYLQRDYSFGYKGLNNEEPPYNQGYPYRSLIILRKYRILPVGWEVAAQFIQKNNKTTNPPVNTQDIRLMDLIRCFDPCDEYEGYNDGTGPAKAGNCRPQVPATPQSWCTGLVDPNWVLEVPKMYCKAQGYGPEVQNSQYINQGKFCSNKADKACVDECSNLSGNFDTSTCCQANEGECEQKTQLTVTRNQNYCADEQSCIKENNDGSCAYYGYCTEEKRQWTFTQDSRNQCQPINNTCQTFTGNGKTVSYLENTLDYGSCGPNEVGCARYAMNGAYNTVTKKVDWSTSTESKFLNKNSESCDPDKEGCHQFIRTKDDNDTNLIADGSFEGSQCIPVNGGIESAVPKNKFNPFIKSALAQVTQGNCQLTTLNNSGNLTAPNGRWYIRVNSGSVNAGIVNDIADHGSQSLYIEGAGGIYSKDNVAPSLLPTGFSFEDSRFYTLSATVFVTAGKVRAGFGSGANGQFAESTATNSWQNLLVTYYRTAGGASDFYIEGVDGTAKFYIDELKLTVGNANTTYSDYLSNNVVYQKLLPKYLEAACYVSSGDGDAPGSANYQYKDNAPAECFNFTRKCNADEVGCEQYTSTTTNIAITGKVKPKDYCPGSCIGYDVFVEQPTYFSAASSQYFIPQTAKSCSAQAVGCSAFTNLDKEAAGGEAVEYYSYLRSCIKPDAGSCGEFYTWEGSDEAGFQLKVYSLKQNGNEPASTLTPEEEALVCNETIFKKSPSEPGYNYDCREFYNRDGQVSYHLYTRTISCSDDCHPYRREVANQAECTAGGGTWDITQSRCLYYAISNEATSCSAPEVGCREYTGNIANNTQIVLNDDFEPGTTTDEWNGGSQSNTALNLGGHSLLGSNFSKTVGTIVERDESYTISFLAKAQTGSAVVASIDLVNQANQSAVFSTGASANVTSDWKLYTFNLDKLDHEVTPTPSQGDAPDTGEKLRINFTQAVFIDNIKLTEVPNRYYIIKDSWNTPDECDQTVTGAYSPRYMLGCSQYETRDNTTVNLHSFSQLCQDSAAGCEQMIDTKNSGDFRKRLYNDTNINGVCDAGENSCVEVAADAMMNIVYDRTKECGASDKGCSRYGKASTYDTTTTYADTFKKDNPDTYNTSLCNQAAVGCEAWSNGNGTAYFKDPGNQACEYRAKKGTNNQLEWFRTLRLKRCGGTPNGTVCTADAECGNQQCIDTDDPCPVTTTKTIGIGGRGNAVEQPTNNWAGLCAPTQSGCTEYIDPVSRFNNNLIVNPNHDDGEGGVPHPGWTGLNGNSQDMGSTKVEPNTLYILSGAGGKIEDWGDDSLYQLDSATNQFKLVNAQNPFKAVPANNDNDSVSTVEFFIIPSDTFDGFTVTRGSTTPTTELKKAAVGYQLRQNLDKSPTTVDFKTGRILFNERRVSGSGMAPLSYNADYTAADSSTGNTPSGAGTRNANVILKVSPDRSCSKWLSCRSFGTDPNDPSKQICFDIGQCTSLSPSGECESFDEGLDLKNQTLTSLNYDAFANMTGYSKVGYEGNLLNADMYNLGTMKQIGGSASVKNGSFETASDWSGGAILNKPSATQSIANSDGTLPDGTGVLKVTNSETAKQVNINLQADATYVISAYVYIRGGNLSFKMNNSQEVFNTSNDLKGRWVRKVGTFKPSNNNPYELTIIGTDEGEKYIDDVRIESVLNNRCFGANCDGATVGQRWYTASMCRLYPKADSLGCQYEDSSSVIQKGWRGYCLETDPKNPQACLLWYPVDRIISEGSEEGAGLIISSDLSYCTQAEDRCTNPNQNNNTSQIYCQTFAKVDSTKYWRSRLIEGSNYVLPLPDGTIDLGYGGIGTNNEKLPVTINAINRFSNLSLYGGYTLNNSSSLATIEYNAATLYKMNPFLPYFAVLTPDQCNDGRGYGDANVCKGCQNSFYPHGYPNGCNTGDCNGGSENENCKESDIYTISQIKYDNCTISGGYGGTHITQGTGNDAGRWGTVTYGGDGCPSSSASCYFSTQAYQIAPSKATADQAVRRLFASGTGDLSWNNTSYVSTGNSWGTPGTKCFNNKRPIYNTSTRQCTAADGVTVGSCISGSVGQSNSTNDYCYVEPNVFNLKVGRDSITSGTYTVEGAGYVELKFNSKIDPEQLPLTSYNINWDEGATDPTQNTNANMYDRPNESSPHVFRHYYSYADLKAGLSSQQCPTSSNYCLVRPVITITDNWGKPFILTSPVQIKVTDN